MNMFEKACKEKIRFKTSSGILTVEDLYDISLSALDKMYIDLNKSISKENSLLKSNEQDEESLFKSELIKYIVNDRLEAVQANINSKAREAKKRELLDIINKKENEMLLDKSVEELKTMLKDME